MKDILGRTVKVGDTVLTRGYSTVDMNQTAIVEKVKDSYILVTVRYKGWLHDDTIGRKTLTVTSKKVTRRPYQVLVVNDQLKENERIGEPYVSPYDVP